MCADGANWALGNEENGSNRACWKIVEVEEESSPMAVAIQMEVAKTLETIRMDQAQRRNNHEVTASSSGSARCDTP